MMAVNWTWSGTINPRKHQPEPWTTRVTARAAALAGLVCASLLAGCTAPLDEADESAAAMRSRAEASLAELDGYGVDGAGVIIPQGEVDDAVVTDAALPARFAADDAIYLAVYDPLAIVGLLARLEKMTGIPHVFFAGPEQVLDTSGEGVMEAGDGVATAQVYAGSLGDVLDTISGRYDLEWRYRDAQVEVREYVARMYRLPVLPKQFSSSRTMGTVTVATRLDPASEIIEAITRIAGPGADLAYAGGTGMLMVKARPGKQREIADHIGRIEQDLEQQLAFDIHVLTVVDTAERGSGARFNLDVLGDEAKIRWSGNTAPVKPSETFNVGITKTDFKLDLLVSALDRHGKVTVETRTGATTSNNQMVPIQVVRETAYVKKVNAAPDADGNLQTSIEPGNLTTGFEMHLYPRILDGGRVLLNYSIRLSELDRLDDFNTGANSIQLPSVSTTVFEQQAILGNGETLVLAGFERDRTTADRSRGMLFTSKDARSVDHVATVILIRARILGRRLNGKGAA